MTDKDELKNPVDILEDIASKHLTKPVDKKSFDAMRRAMTGHKKPVTIYCHHDIENGEETYLPDTQGDFWTWIYSFATDSQRYSWCPKVRITLQYADQPTEVEVIRAELQRIKNRPKLDSCNPVCIVEDLIDFLDVTFGTGEG